MARCIRVLSILSLALVAACSQAATAPASYPSPVLVANSTGAGGLPFSAVCNGVALTGHEVVTAAHCVDEASSGDLLVLSGGQSRCSPIGWRQSGIEELRTTDLDLAVLTLTSSATPAPLPTLPQGLHVIGYGRPGGGSDRCSLEALPVTETPRRLCQAPGSAMDPAPDLWLCFSNATICAGFSGSGVFADGLAVAVVSHGTSL